MNAPILVDPGQSPPIALRQPAVCHTFAGNETDPLEIARKELAAGKIPFIVRRCCCCCCCCCCSQCAHESRLHDATASPEFCPTARTRIGTRTSCSSTEVCSAKCQCVTPVRSASVLLSACAGQYRNNGRWLLPHLRVICIDPVLQRREMEHETPNKSGR
jgi:hypothetical protein